MKLPYRMRQAFCIAHRGTARPVARRRSRTALPRLRPPARSAPSARRLQHDVGSTSRTNRQRPVMTPWCGNRECPRQDLYKRRRIILHRAASLISPQSHRLRCRRQQRERRPPHPDHTSVIKRGVAPGVGDPRPVGSANCSACPDAPAFNTRSRSSRQASAPERVRVAPQRREMAASPELVARNSRPARSREWDRRLQG